MTKSKTPKVARKSKTPKVARNKKYREISGPDGIVRCEPGHLIVTYSDKSVAVMPPEVFAERHPELL